MNKPLDYLRTHERDAVARLTELLAIPSVSTDPAYKADIARAAEWVAAQLEASGLDTRIMPTDGHPVVLGSTKPDAAPAAAPRVLFYGHYDVQPPDPLAKWTTPPFEPTIRASDHGQAIYARGASDDKGQVCCFLEALRAWSQAAKHNGGKFPCHVTVLIEGEEECGSPSLPAFLKEHKDLLKVDIAIISDTHMWNPQTVSITYALRGLVYFDIQLHGPNRDLHSGIYGGALANPATMLARVLGKLFDEHNRVTVPGFYEDVATITDEERARWKELHFDEMRDCLAPLGVDTPFGEEGFSTLERRWARPSCDINGLYGGYMSEGAKTVIPSFAGAKVSFRLAANQNSKKIADAFEQWLRAQDTGGCKWKITNHGLANPVAVAIDSPWIAAARRAIEKASGRPPVLMREGATIPVVADFKNLLGVDTLLVGFGLVDDRIHSPNEHFALSRFTLGCRTHAVMLAELGGVTDF